MVSICNCRFTEDNPVIVRRSAALGDVVAASIVADRLYEMGYNVIFQSFPFYHAALRYHPKIIGFEDIVRECNVNLDGAYEKHPRKHALSFHEIFIQTANEQLQYSGIQLPMNLKPPRLYVLPQYQKEVLPVLDQYPKPWVMINPRSINWTHRTVQPHVWQKASQMIEGTVFWIGLDPCPSGPLVDLQIRHVDRLVHYISCADMVVTVDSGPAHLAAALEIPLVVVHQSINPYLTVGGFVDLDTIWAPVNCLNCQHIRCPINGNYPPCQNINPEQLANLVNSKLSKI